MTVPSDVINKELYRKDRFERWPSAYGSAWLVKTYKQRGGRYSSERSSRRSKKSRKSGVSRWMEEKWIQVVPYLKNGTIRECGSKIKKQKHADLSIVQMIKPL